MFSLLFAIFYFFPSNSTNQSNPKSAGSQAVFLWWWKFTKSTQWLYFRLFTRSSGLKLTLRKTVFGTFGIWVITYSLVVNGFLNSFWSNTLKPSKIFGETLYQRLFTSQKTINVTKPLQNHSGLQLETFDRHV